MILLVTTGGNEYCNEAPHLVHCNWPPYFLPVFLFKIVFPINIGAPNDFFDHIYCDELLKHFSWCFQIYHMGSRSNTCFVEFSAGCTIRFGFTGPLHAVFPAIHMRGSFSTSGDVNCNICSIILSQSYLS